MNVSQQETWWNRPCGVAEVLRLALPLVASAGSWTFMHFTDRMFLLWHSTAEVAASMPSGVLCFTLTCPALGLVMYVTTFVAQYRGAGHPERVGAAVAQGVRVALWATPLMLVTIPLAPWFFAWIGHEPSIVRLEVTFYQTMVWSTGGTLLSAALASFFIGLGKTKVVMLVDAAGAGLNVLLDYLLIFGHAGFPEMGIQGAALATVTALWSQVFVYAAVMWRPEYRKTYHLAEGWRSDPELMRRLWRYGGPNGLQMFVEVAAFSLFILFVGRLGEQALAATNLAFNINMLAFMPTLGLGQAVGTMVGHQLGRRHPELAARAAWTSFWIAEAYMGALAALYVVTPDLFLWGHAQGTSPAEFARIHDLTIILLRFVAAYSLLDAMNVIFVGVLKGAGDTRFVLGTTTGMAPLPLALAWWGTTSLGLGLLWCWVVITIWVCALALAYFGRFLRGHWRGMRVIEPDLIEPSLDRLDLEDDCPADDEEPSEEVGVSR